MCCCKEVDAVNSDFLTKFDCISIDIYGIIEVGIEISQIMHDKFEKYSLNDPINE